MSQKTKMATASHSGGAGALEHLARTLHEQLAEAQPKLITVFTGPRLPLGEICAHFKRLHPAATVLGATALGEFNEAAETQGGIAVSAIAGGFEVLASLELGIKEDVEGTVERCLADMDQERLSPYAYKTAILLLDGLAGKGEETTLTAALALGDGYRVTGGCAGEDFATGATAVALDERAAPTNGLVIALIGTHKPLGIAMDHGMEAISEPLRVTKAAGNVVLEVEGRPAWDVWKEITAPHASEQGLDLEALNTNADVQTYLSHFQLGLSTGKAGERLKIRWPAGLTPEGGIAFASGIPEGCVIRITKGSVKSHIASATRAAVQARALAGTKLAGALVFDCGIRKVTLGDRFFDAVKAISSALDGVPLAGFETFGEVALEPGDFSGFHNTSTVVLAFPE